MPEHQMKAGELVALRPPTEILATLDENGTTDGLPFMPEMLEFYGKTFRVEARAERACDTMTWGVRRIPDTVLLDDLRCSGGAHAGCQASCRLFWKEAWLRPASESATSHPRHPTDAYSELEKLVGRNVEAKASTADEPIFRCQATDWFAASEAVGWWNVRSFFNELSCGNVGFWRFSTTMTRIVLGEIGRRLHLIPRGELTAHDPSAGPAETPPPRWLEPGSLVQIRSKQEIEPTLDPTGRNKGLFFDRREMLPFCGKTFPIKSRVERFVDEKTGKLIQLKSDCYILDGVVCSGNRSSGKWFCRRAIYSYWREAWLEPVTDETRRRRPQRIRAEAVGRVSNWPSSRGGDAFGLPSKIAARVASRMPWPTPTPELSQSARAGTPRTTSPGATSRVTTAPAPTSAPAPTRTPPSTTAPEPIDAPRSTTVSSSSQSASP